MRLCTFALPRNLPNFSFSTTSLCSNITYFPAIPFSPGTSRRWLLLWCFFLLHDFNGDYTRVWHNFTYELHISRFAIKVCYGSSFFLQSYVRLWPLLHRRHCRCVRRNIIISPPGSNVCVFKLLPFSPFIFTNECITCCISFSIVTILYSTRILYKYQELRNHGSF